MNKLLEYDNIVSNASIEIFKYYNDTERLDAIEDGEQIGSIIRKHFPNHTKSQSSLHSPKDVTEKSGLEVVGYVGKTIKDGHIMEAVFELPLILMDSGHGINDQKNTLACETIRTDCDHFLDMETEQYQAIVHAVNNHDRLTAERDRANKLIKKFKVNIYHDDWCVSLSTCNPCNCSTKEFEKEVDKYLADIGKE